MCSIHTELFNCPPKKKKKLLNEFKKFVPLNKLSQTFWTVKTPTGFCFLMKLISAQLLLFRSYSYIVTNYRVNIYIGIKIRRSPRVR